MIFFSENSCVIGSTFLGGDQFTLPCTPTNINNITKIEISNATVDEFYVTYNMDDEQIEQNTLSETWDFDTVMMAHFDNDTSAGNVNWHLKELKSIIIKLKPEDDARWITCHVKPVSSYEDLVIVGKYLAAMSGIWDVALVPIIISDLEGTYITTQVEVNVEGLVIMDADAVHGTFLVDGGLSIQSVMPNQAVNTIHNKFPYIIRNTRANYETVEVTCTFLPNDKDCLNYDDEIKANAKWNREMKAWLMNGKAKLLKSSDGDMWLGYITTPVSDQPYADGFDELRKYSFGLTEIGLPNDMQNLYDAGLLDPSVTAEWH